MSRLPFSAIPHQSRLFVEYQHDPVSLRKFYQNVVVSPSRIESYIPTMLERYVTDRDKLCNALTEINSKIGAGKTTHDNIRLLRLPETVAVVTGQQAGLFSGPLYTIYKALSAVKMAADLNEKGIRAVPVFWVATEDHDFDEVSETFFIGKGEDLRLTEYRPAGYSESSPVGRVEIDAEIGQVIEQVFADLPETEFSTDICELLTESWMPGSSFGDAFAKTLAAILDKYGIVFIDPMNERIKRLSSPIYAMAVRNADEIASRVTSRNAELEKEGFHAQVLVEENYFPLFWHNDAGRRMALRKVGDGVYRAKEDRREFRLAELERTASDDPQRFSPGVMLRPVVQDFLLPTACYFGGGAEIAYFAQNSEVYRVLNRPVTPVFHRQSFTVVEARYRRVLEKLGLEFSQLFGGLEKTLLTLAEENFSPDTARLFAKAEETINSELNALDHTLSQIDPTLAENLAKRRRKIIYHIAALRKKTLLAQGRKDDTLNRQVENLFASLLPNGELQERSINVVSFLNKFGSGFIEWIYEAIDLEDKDHRIVEL